MIGIETILREICAAMAVADGPVAKIKELKAGASRLATPVRHGFVERDVVIDYLLEQAGNVGLTDAVGERVVIEAIADALDNPADDSAPSPNGSSEGDAGPASNKYDIPLTIDAWLSRTLPSRDLLVGEWFCTTTRGLMTAPTGLGKTKFLMRFGMAMAAGVDFLQWRGHRPARVLYVDGEMSRRLLKDRIGEGVEELGFKPESFFSFSHEDIEDFAPLNTKRGQAHIEKIIEKVGGIDAAIFDSVMCLTGGDMKEEESWQQTLPWVKSLTKRNIGQLWAHHTGHDETRSYGTKTREWQLDAVMHLERYERIGIDVSFTLEFRKARERRPENRLDFQAVRVALVDGQWEYTPIEGTKVPNAKLSPLGTKFLDALRNATIGNDANKVFGCPAASFDRWRSECVKTGLIDDKAPANRTRAMLSKYKLELIAANKIACNNSMAWIVS